tara:strand:+ start:632 stop:1105 length:474 start_codon:yes stop_codon:yes gene_type:complete
MSALPTSPEKLSELAEVISEWLDNQLSSKTLVQSVEHNQNESRWYVRISGEDKDNSMVLFTLGQRTLHFETYFMPSPEENRQDVFQYLLRKNSKLYGVSFGVGNEEAVYLSGQINSEVISSDTLDWVLGTIYKAVEECFKPALRLGFASRFKNNLTD